MNKHDNLNEGDLLAYIDGDTTDAVRQQIEASPALMAEVAATRKMIATFNAALPRQFCPTGDELLQYAFYLLSNEQHLAIEQHLHACPQCRCEAAGVARGIQLPAAQPGWMERLIAAGKRLIDALPSLEEPAIELRGSAEKNTTYTAEKRQVIVAVREGTNGTLEIEGQLLDETNAAADFTGTALLLHNYEIIREGVIEPFGYFEFADVTMKDWSLVLEFSADAIRITPQR